MSYNNPEYWKIPGFEDIYLADSYTLAIETKPDLELVVDTVLKRSHPLYTDPLPSQWACFRKMRIKFPHTRELKWLRKTMQPTTDINGEVDYGNIYDFYLENAHYRLEADWGEVEFISDPPTIEVAD